MCDQTFFFCRKAAIMIFSMVPCNISAINIMAIFIVLSVLSVINNRQIAHRGAMLVSWMMFVRLRIAVQISVLESLLISIQVLTCNVITIY